MSRQLFVAGRNSTKKFAVLLILSAFIMIVDIRSDQSGPMRSVVATITYPIQWVLDLPTRVITWASDSLRTRDELQTNVAVLEVENKSLKIKLLEYQSLLAENERLSELLDSSKRINYEYNAARILSVDNNPYRHIIVLNKGAIDGVELNMPFIDASGVMGQVTRVHATHAEGMLITDPSHAIPVRVLRNGIRTIAQGTGATNELSLLYLPNNSDIVVGDLIVASGLGQRFPIDYPVAIVSKVENIAGENFSRVFATPLGSIDSAREVLLIAPQTEEQQPVAEPGPEGDSEPDQEIPNSVTDPS